MSSSAARAALLLGSSLALLATAASGLGAQTGTPNSASASLRVTAEVQGILMLAGLNVTGVAETKTKAEVKSLVEVRGNIGYQVAVRAAQSAPAGSTVQVRGAEGTWTTLNGTDAVVVGMGEPGETSVKVECRVTAAAVATRLGACALTYELASRERAYAVRAQGQLAMVGTPSDPAAAADQAGLALARAGY